MEYCDCLLKKGDNFNRNFCSDNVWHMSEQLPKFQLQNKVRGRKCNRTTETTSSPSPFIHCTENHKCFTISYFTEKTHTLKAMPEFVLKKLYQTVLLMASLLFKCCSYTIYSTFLSENLAFITLFKEREVSFISI